MNLRNDNIRMMAGGEVENQPCKPIRLLSLFSGIGAFEKALDRENIPYELANFCEIDKFAVKSYCAVHGVSEDKNLGDISKVNTADIPNCDLVTYGFCCQDISVAGKQAGIIAGVTRSGLLYEALRIIEAEKPSYAICENVKNLVGKKFKPDFDKLLFMLEELGYNNYWQVLNAKDYGIPQNRERVFVISIRKDIDNGTFEFPKKFPLELRLKDMLEDEVDEKFYLTPKQIKCFNVNEPKGTDILHVGNTKSGGQKSDIILADGISSCLNATDYKQPKQIVERMYRQAFETLDENDCKAGDVINPYNKKVVADGTCPTLTTRPEGFKTANLVVTDQQIVDTPAYESVTQVNDNYAMLNGGTRAYKDYSPTLRATRSGLKVATDFRIRKLTPKECWRLMGFDDSDFDKAKAAGISASQLYKQAGNSIVVNVLQYIFRNLFKGADF